MERDYYRLDEKLLTEFFFGENSTNSNFWSKPKWLEISPECTNLPLSIIEHLNFNPQLTSKPFEVHSSNSIKISKSKYQMNLGGKNYDIGLSDNNTPEGVFYVCEKWTNPYWKSKTKIWLPGDSNPIGNYLIILSDDKGKKISTSIHQWIQWEYSSRKFQQGNHGVGCIRTKPEEMKEIFDNVSLGTQIEISK